MPFNIIEALGTGAVVLCSDIKGQRDLITDGENGFLYPLNDVYAFADRVIAIHAGARPDPEKVLATYKAYEWDNVFESTYATVREALEK